MNDSQSQSVTNKKGGAAPRSFAAANFGSCSTGLLADVLENIDDGVSVQDRDMRVIYANAAKRSMFGEDIVGRPCFEAYDRRSVICPECPVREALETGESVRAMRYGSDKNGKQMAIDIVATPLRDNDGEIIACIDVARDITEQEKYRNEIIAGRLRLASSPDLEDKESLIEELRESSIALMDQYDRLLAAEEKNRAYSERLEQMVEERTRDLAKRTRELEALYSVLSAATHSLDLSKMMKVSVSEVADLISAFAMAAFVTDSETERLRLVAQNGFSPEFLRWVSSVPGGEGVFASVLDQAKGEIINDMAEDKNLASLLGIDPEQSNLVVIPMKSPTQVMGLIVGACSNEQKIDYNGWQLLNSIGEELGVVVENIRLYENLRYAYLSTIQALAEAIDARDAYTKGHSENVSNLAIGIAEKMGLNEEEIDDLRDAGYLHDIGKIGTPDAVLMKEGLLTAEEMETMRKHPSTSFHILSEAHLTDGIKEMIKHHHERYDGQGYPDRLKGEDIPLGSRILAVADAYEAMISDRPYRPRMSIGEAVTELKINAGTQFDPAVVEIFIQNLEKKGSASAGA